MILVYIQTVLSNIVICRFKYRYFYTIRCNKKTQMLQHISGSVFMYACDYYHYYYYYYYYYYYLTYTSNDIARLLHLQTREIDLSIQWPISALISSLLKHGWQGRWNIWRIGNFWRFSSHTYTGKNVKLWKLRLWYKYIMSLSWQVLLSTLSSSNSKCQLVLLHKLTESRRQVVSSYSK